MKYEGKFWLFTEHSEHIEFTDYSYKDLRKLIDTKTNFKLATINSSINAIFDWDNISPHFAFFFDYMNNEKEISNFLKETSLPHHDYVYVETNSDLPIIKVPTSYFIENWEEFIRANHGMGSIVVTEDLEVLLEFTDDAEYMLYSNIKIKPD